MRVGTWAVPGEGPAKGLDNFISLFCQSKGILGSLGIGGGGREVCSKWAFKYASQCCNIATTINETQNAGNIAAAIWISLATAAMLH